MQRTLLFVFLIICQANAAETFVELLGMGHLLEGMGKMSPTVNYMGEASTAYMLDPSIDNFLRQFNTRTEFCDYKCNGFFNLPCFMLFGCNIHLRNFLLAFLLPIVVIAITGLCCGKGIWTFPCWLRYLAVFTGVAFLIWAVKKCAGGQKIRERK